MHAEESPLPIEETTPPVMKINLVGRAAITQSTRGEIIY
jgi:hypothetical protein